MIAAANVHARNIWERCRPAFRNAGSFSQQSPTIRHRDFAPNGEILL
jgi:hypothetical protein